MRRIRGGQLAKAMLFGALGTLLGVAINAALDYARQDWTNPVGIAVVAVLASASGVIPLLQADRSEPVQPTGRGTVYPSGRPPSAVGHAQVPPYQAPGAVPPYDWNAPYGPPAPARARGGRVPLLAAGLVLLVLCGGGAAGLTYGVKYFGAWITGDERGTEILVAPASAQAGPLTLTVTNVVQTNHFTRVKISATYSGDESPKLVTGFAQLTGDRGTALKADPFRSDWPEDVPAGVPVAGWLVFKEVLPSGTASASLTFTTIFGTLRGERSITVSGIRLRT
jgi:hypothetical protein